MALSWQALEPDFGLTPPAPLPQGRGGKARGKQPPWSYFKLMVVFTPWPAVLSSNQRAVTVLVWV